MGMSEEEKFIFDLNGYVIRESVLSFDEIIKIKKQIELIHSEPDSLPEASQPHSLRSVGCTSRDCRFSRFSVLRRGRLRDRSGVDCRRGLCVVFLTFRSIA